MSIQSNKELMERWSLMREDLVEEVYAANHTLHFNGIVPEDYLRTTDVVRGFIANIRKAIPDITVTIDDMILEEDKVAILATWEGTHSGPWGDIPPTNLHFRWTDMNIVRIRDGLITDMTAASRYGFTELFHSGDLDENERMEKFRH